MVHLHSCDALSIPICKTVSEYQLPGAAQTHEIVYVAKEDINREEDVLLISQQNPFRLLKLKLDPTTAKPSCVHSFSIGTAYSGIHGLFASTQHKGCVWVTLQFDNAIILVDAAKDTEADIVRKKIQLPKSVYGPHCIVESGGTIWASCKESCHVVKVNTSTNEVEHIYDCIGKPIFVAVHPRSGDVYASLMDTNQILRIPPKGDSKYIHVPPVKGSHPVSIVAGPNGNLWVTLLSSESGGGTFGRIAKNGVIAWFSLEAIKNRVIGLLHLAFDTFNKGDTHMRMWLLSSSVDSKSSPDAILVVNFDVKKDPHNGIVVPQDVIFLSTHGNGAHRVMRHRTGLFVTQLSVSIVAHVSGDGVGMDRKQLNCGCSSNGSGGCSCKCKGDCGCPLSCACKSSRDAFQYLNSG